MYCVLLLQFIIVLDMNTSDMYNFVVYFYCICNAIKNSYKPHEHYVCAVFCFLYNIGNRK